MSFDISKINTQDVVNAIKLFMKEQEYDGFAVNCQTREEAEMFLSGLHAIGRYWSEDQPIIKDGNVITYYKYRSETCYRFFLQEKNVMKAQKSYYEKKGITIYTFTELIEHYLNLTPDKTNKNSDAEHQSELLENTKSKPETPNTTTATAAENEKAVNNDEPKDVRKEMAARTSQAAQNDALPNICRILNVKVKEPFYIECSRILLFLPNTPYRINENVMREFLADAKNEAWVPCNDERELAYLICHPEIVIVNHSA